MRIDRFDIGLNAQPFVIAVKADAECAGRRGAPVRFGYRSHIAAHPVGGS